MHLRVSAPNQDLSGADVDRITKDLEKVDRRLSEWSDVYGEVRINGKDRAMNYHVTLEINYGRNHIVAKAGAPDVGWAVREAREEALRQINDRGRGSHAQYAKRGR